MAAATDEVHFDMVDNNLEYSILEVRNKCDRPHKTEQQPEKQN